MCQTLFWALGIEQGIKYAETPAFRNLTFQQKLKSPCEQSIQIKESHSYTIKELFIYLKFKFNWVSSYLLNLADLLVKPLQIHLPSYWPPLHYQLFVIILCLFHQILHPTSVDWFSFVFINLKHFIMVLLLLLLLSHFSRVRLCATPSLGFSGQEHWSGLPFPSPMHKSEK